MTTTTVDRHSIEPRLPHTSSTGLAAYGLDRERLAAVAERIGAITSAQLATPLQAPPDEWAILARSQTVFPKYHAANLDPARG